MRVSHLAVPLAVLLSAFVPALHAQERADRGILQLSVVDAGSDAPLGYAVVTLARVSIERFTDSRGRLAIPDLEPGTYDVSVRRLGFLPYRAQANVTAGAPTVFDVRMTRVPQQLSRVQVTAAVLCANPGAPDETREPEVYTLVSLLRENADRYRLLVSAHPFVSMLARTLGDLQAEALYVETVDVSGLPGKTTTDYRSGQVVRRRGNQYSMGLPTIVDLADDRFARSHCFYYGGTTQQTTPSGEETWYRLDVRADDKLNSPDVHGAFYLDSATSQLRKMDLELSRPDRLPRQLASIASVHVSTAFVEIANGLSVIQSVCAVTRLHPTDKPMEMIGRPTMPVELQQLVSYAFATPPPDVAAKRTFDAPDWQPRTYMPLKTVWCEGANG